jgi:hypothetical protein
VNWRSGVSQKRIFNRLKGGNNTAQGNAPYALTCLDEFLLRFQEKNFLRLAPAWWFSQPSGDSFPVLEHLLEGKPRSYGLDYLTEGEGKFPPAAKCGPAC